MSIVFQVFRTLKHNNRVVILPKILQLKLGMREVDDTEGAIKILLCKKFRSTDFKIKAPEVQSEYRKLFDKVGEAEGLNSLRGF